MLIYNISMVRGRIRQEWFALLSDMGHHVALQDLALPHQVPAWQLTGLPQDNVATEAAAAIHYTKRYITYTLFSVHGVKL